MTSAVRSRGFTLLEILIALAVFALTSSSLITGITRHASQARLLEEKTLAHWVAENEMARLQLARTDKDNSDEDRLPRSGVQHLDVRMADRDWQVRIDVANTENKDISRITVEVFAADGDPSDPPLVDLVGFMGRH